LGAEFNAENYSSIDAAELDAIVEAYKILVKQAVSLSLSGEQVGYILLTINQAYIFNR
jgi:hypothetical protein